MSSAASENYDWQHCVKVHTALDVGSRVNSGDDKDLLRGKRDKGRRRQMERGRKMIGMSNL